MQSVKTPLLLEESSVSSLSSIMAIADDNRVAEIPDNRRHIQPTNSSHNVSISPTTNKLSPPSDSALTTTTTTSATTAEDDDEDENDDGDPLLRDAEMTTTMRKQPSTLFSPMSDSCESSLVGGSASESALATPMEISRSVLGSGFGKWFWLLKWLWRLAGYVQVVFMISRSVVVVTQVEVSIRQYLSNHNY